MKKNKILFEKVRSTHERKELETIATSLSAYDFLSLLAQFSKEQVPFEKLPPILVGFPSAEFFLALLEIPKNSLEILKHGDLLEPLLHQIKLFTLEYEKYFFECQEGGIYLLQTIKEINFKELNFKVLNDINNQFSSLKYKLELLENGINNALAIAWNTNRIDLIEILDQMKARTNHYYIWCKQELKDVIDYELSHIYGIHKQGENDRVLQDDDLAIDGLTRLGIWYLKDYWDIGLLPSIKNVAELEDEKEKNFLFDLVQNNLNQINLKTVGQLKAAQIFSKAMLKEFIELNANKIKNFIG